MAKTIEIEYEGKTYTLEFTRNSVKQLENRGFKISELRDKPANLIPEFFAGAFIANHRFVKREIVDKIFDNLKNKDGLIEVLGDMYNDTLTSLIGDDEEKEGNIAWKVV